MRWWHGVSLAILAAVACGCGSSQTGPALVDVKGTVELDGKPMATGKVSFDQTGIPQDMLEVKDGVFAGKAKVGKAKVGIHQFRPGKIPDMYKEKDLKDKDAFIEEVIPPAYNSESKVFADITESGPNEFKFSAKTK